ncbi:hypothetical protein KKG61_04080 [bacterium]|nr:hypothetical protein [bacterium]MBU1599267.1 hypothetical protein [bacterium]
MGCGQEALKLPEAKTDFSGECYENGDYRFKIKLYADYKKIKEEGEAVLFAEKDGNITIIFWKEGGETIKQFYQAIYKEKERLKDKKVLSALGIERKPDIFEPFKVEKADSFIILTTEREGFEKIIRIKIEIFPEGSDIQITVLGIANEKELKRVWEMINTITIF